MRGLRGTTTTWYKAYDLNEGGYFRYGSCSNKVSDAGCMTSHFN